MLSWARWAALAVAVACVVAAAMGPAVGRQAEAKADQPAEAKAEFAEALGRMKKLMAYLTVLQAQYQQPKADKSALEASFEAVKQEAEAAG